MARRDRAVSGDDPRTIADVSGLRLADSTDQFSTADQLRQLVARYTRAIDMQDADALGRLFAEDGTIEFWQRDTAGTLSPVAPPARTRTAIVAGAAAYAEARRGVIAHHMTHDLIMELDGDRARVSAQFIVTRALPDAPGLDAAPSIVGQALLTLTGYYDIHLRRADGRWEIALLRDVFDLPYKMPV